MEQQEINEVLACLPTTPIKFYYFRDYYAILLLSYLVGEGMKVHEMKKSRYKKLINKPLIKELLHNAGDSILSREVLGSFWPQDYHCYLLTLDKWGGKEQGARFYNQTSRPGWNLVLQLNFSTQHNRVYNRLIKPQRYHPFERVIHPISSSENMHTLAWARIDFDLEQGEALIEELQNDWIRLALKSRKQIGRYKNAANQRHVPFYIKELGCDANALSVYIDNVLKPHALMWQEAMLMATVWFLKEEIGISDIFYHTFDFGCRLKRITFTRPPRSLYTKLPEKFCFEKSERVPEFLLRKNNRNIIDLIKRKNHQFYLLSI